jgi:predicted nucleic acid-binding protein
MANYTAIYDACVLYPAPLRDLLIQLGLTGLFRPRWTEEIHEEWIRNVLKKRPDLSREQLTRTKQLMNQAIQDCLVTDYQPMIEGLKLPDPDDRHVLAAAIHTRAEVIVTFNYKDFPQTILAKYNIVAEHPDEFIGHLIDLNQNAVALAVKKQRQRLKNPPYSQYEFLEILRKQQLTKTVSFLEDIIDLI